MVGFFRATSAQTLRLRELVAMTGGAGATWLHLRSGQRQQVRRRARSVCARLKAPRRRLPGIVWLRQP